MNAPRKRWLKTTIVTLACLALVLAACGDNGEDAGSADVDAESAADDEADDTTVDEEGEGEGTVSAAEFYEGETVRFIIPFGPGGGFDRYARLIAPYLAEELGANVVVENIPGAGGLVGINEMAAADPDGLTIAIMQVGGAASVQLGAPGELRVDLRDLNYLGNLAQADNMWVVGAHTGWNSVEDVQEAGSIMMGATGIGSVMAIEAMLFEEIFDIEVDLVPGFDEVSDILLATVAGDLDGSTSTFQSNVSAVEAGDLVPILRTAYWDHPAAPDTPRISDFDFETEEQRELAEIHLLLFNYYRALATTPGVPEDRVEFLRDALDRVAENPEVLEEGETTANPIDWTPGQQIQDDIPTILDAPDIYVQMLTAGN